ncbi:MAG: YkgJ family cysteine cluster protein [Chitinispirillaceae bacterium]|nr:YkgJ family cysteine cluster protein [Chitinispirillaceae bacterium]
MQSLHQSKQPLSVPPAAHKTHAEIFRLLTSLEAGDIRSCLEPEFKKRWAEILELIDRYQIEIADASGMAISCRKRCAACCWHWVEDVNSFEAEIIAEHLKEHHPEKIGRIVRQCRDDEKTLRDLNEIVESKLASARSDPSAAAIDPVDLLLASFYRLRKPCPLLDNGLCLAYAVRPLTCRMYASFSPPERCDPDYIDEGDIPTYLFDLEEEANSVIDRLHFRFLKSKNITGLRPLLAGYLR